MADTIPLIYYVYNFRSYVVRSVVNSFSNELTSMDVLYAINAKKESTAVLNAPRVSTPSYRTTISIFELLDYVNRYFPDILPESVLRHYGQTSRPEGKLGESALYSLKTDNRLSKLATNRELLAKAAESTIQHEVEANKPEQYRALIYFPVLP